VVLSQLGHRCGWAGVLSDEPDAQRIIDDLKQYQVDTNYCRVVKGGKTPTSYITHNQQNGSRTIIHHRDLPEFSFSNFEQIELSECDWLHFEGRNVGETDKMLLHTAENYPQLPCSLEIEKPRPKIGALIKYAGTLFFSKNYVLEQEDNNSERAPMRFLQQLHQQYPEKRIICAWGEDGAYGIDHHGVIHHAPARPPPKIVDTLGAGDTFNAAVINSLISGLNLDSALNEGCRIAGEKCGHMGLNFINPL